MQFEPSQKPKQIICDNETLTEDYGKFIAEPFERGFGHTIGNSLRRILLSSISGAAIAAIPVIKEEFGLPTGCAIHNVVEKSKWLDDFENTRKSVDASSNVNIPLFGGDFAIFGPMINSDLVFPIIAWQDILISEYTESYFGIKTDN